jgi:hypothetical protein
MFWQHMLIRHRSVKFIIHVGTETVTVAVVMWTPMVCMASVGQDDILDIYHFRRDIPFHPMGWYILTLRWTAHPC